MKCKNTHCKFYEKAGKETIFGVKIEYDGGCRYSYCKKNKGRKSVK